MTSSKIEIPGEVKSDPAALMASLQLMPSPVPNPEIKYTKVCVPSEPLSLCASRRSVFFSWMCVAVCVSQNFFPLELNFFSI